MSLRTVAGNRTAESSREKLIEALTLCKSLRPSEPDRMLQLALTTGERAKREGFTDIQGRAMLQCAQIAHRLGRLAASAGYLRQAENLLAVSGSLQDRLHLHLAWGTYYKERGELVSAYETLHRAVRLCVTTEHLTLKCRALNILGIVFARTGTYDTALRYCFESLEIAEQQNDRSMIASILGNLGSAYYQLGDNDRALEYFSQSLSLSTTLNDRVSIGSQSKNVAVIHRLQKNFPKALEHFERALGIWREIGNRKKEADVLTNIGMVHAESGDLLKGLSVNQEALRCARDLKDTWEYAFILSNLGSIYRMRKEYDKGLAMFFKSLQLFGKLGMRRYENEVRYLLSELYEECGDYRKSLEYQKRYRQVREELQGVEMQRSVAGLEVRQALQKAEEEKALFCRQAEQARIEVETRMKELNTLTVDLTERNEALKSIRVDLLPLLRATEEKTRKNASRIVRQIEEVVTEEKKNLFQEQFEQVYQEFIRQLRELCPSLTPAEIRICVLIKLNLSNKQIAEMLFASPLTVKTHRAHIRRKLGLGKRENLSSILFAM